MSVWSVILALKGEYVSLLPNRAWEDFILESEWEISMSNEVWSDLNGIAILLLFTVERNWDLFW